MESSPFVELDKTQAGTEDWQKRQSLVQLPGIPAEVPAAIPHINLLRWDNTKGFIELFEHAKETGG